MGNDINSRLAITVDALHDTTTPRYDINYRLAITLVDALHDTTSTLDWPSQQTHNGTEHNEQRYIYNITACLLSQSSFSARVASAAASRSIQTPYRSSTRSTNSLTVCARVPAYFCTGTARATLFSSKVLRTSSRPLTTRKILT